MEVVELRSGHRAEEAVLVFPASGEEFTVSHTILSRSPVISDVLMVIGEEETCSSGNICGPPGFLRAWVAFSLAGKLQFAIDSDSDAIIRALKVRLRCVDFPRLNSAAVATAS